MRRCFERMDEYLQPRGVSRQLEESHDADYAEELHDVVLLPHRGHDEVQIEGQRRDDVDYVDGSPNEEQFIVRYDESDDDLEGEPGVADALDVEEGFMWVAVSLVDRPPSFVGVRRCYWSRRYVIEAIGV